MNIVKRLFLLLFLSILTFFKAITTEVAEQYFHVDASKKIILCNYNLAHLQKTDNLISQILFDKIYNFETPQSDLKVGIPYTLIDTENNNSFILYFTELPIIKINSDFEIKDTPKVLANFKLIETDKEEINTYAGIEYRGATSQSYPKKSMEIEFWDDLSGNSTVDIPILGMMNHDAFNLQAMYSEDSRIRSKTANDLWLEMSTLSYQSKEPEAKNGINSRFVEVFINDSYFGVYAVSEKVNRKNLKLKKHNGSIRGELYKGKHWAGAPTMYSYDKNYDNTSDTWSYLEYKHPKDEINWKNIYSFISFVVDSDQPTFTKNIESKFEIDNAIDYFIFMNTIVAIDNTGKNLHIAKYDKSGKYFYVPWDLDATFGYNWDGTLLSKHPDILTNGMYDKWLLDKSFRKKLANRWLDLRKNTLSITNIESILDTNYQYLQKNDVYAREELAWNYTKNEKAIDQMKTWLTNRVSYLDDFFEKFLHIDNTPNKTINLSYYPNPAKNLITIALQEKANMKTIISDQSGKVVLTLNTTDKINTINLSQLSSGTYYVLCEATTATKKFKIIVNK